MDVFAEQDERLYGMDPSAVKPVTLGDKIKAVLLTHTPEELDAIAYELAKTHLGVDSPDGRIFSPDKNTPMQAGKLWETVKGIAEGGTQSLDTPEFQEWAKIPADDRDARYKAAVGATRRTFSAIGGVVQKGLELLNSERPPPEPTPEETKLMPADLASDKADTIDQEMDRDSRRQSWLAEHRKQAEQDNAISGYEDKVYAGNWLARYKAIEPDLSERGKELVLKSASTGQGLAPEDKNAYLSLDPAEQDKVGYLMRLARPAATRNVARDSAFAVSNFIKGSYRKITNFQERIEQGAALSVARMLGFDEKEPHLAARIAMAEETATEAAAKEKAIRDINSFKPYGEDGGSGYTYAEDSVIGFFGSAPYTLAAGIPYVGIPYMVIDELESMRDRVIADGGDPNNAQVMMWTAAVGYALTERLQWEAWTGRPISTLQKRVLGARIAREGWRGAVKFAKAHVKEVGAITVTETAEESIQQAIEEVAVGLSLDDPDTVKKAVRESLQAAKDSLGSMFLFGATGTAIKGIHERGQIRDNESIVDFLQRTLKVNKMLWSTAEAAEPEKNRQALDDARQAWFRPPTISQAVKGLVDLGYTAEQAATLGDYFDAERAVVDPVGTMPRSRYLAEQVADPTAAIRAISPTATVEEIVDKDLAPPASDKPAAVHPTTVSAPGAAISEADRAAAAPGAAISEADRAAAASGAAISEADRAAAALRLRKGVDEKGNQLSRHALRLARAAAAREERAQSPKPAPVAQSAPEPAKPEPKPRAAMKRYRVTFQSAGKLRSYVMEVGPQTANISSPEYASSVQQATGGRIRADAYLAMTPEQQAEVLIEERLYHRGHFQVLDENGKKVIGADGLMFLVGRDDAHPASNMTVFHEHFHAAVAMARDAGALDAGALATMRKVFGGPLVAGEEFNEEAAADAFAVWMAEQGETPAAGAFAKLRDFIESLLRAVGLLNDPKVDGQREKAREAVFQAIRSGDFQGVAQYSGITIGGKEVGKAAGAKGTTTASGGAVGAAGGVPVAAVEGAAADVEAAREGAKVKKDGGGRPERVPRPGGLEDRMGRLEKGQELILARLREIGAAAPGSYAPPVRVGEPMTVHTPTGNIVFTVRWMWVARSDLVDSSNAVYPDEYQPRDRNRTASALQVHKLSRQGTFTFARLTDSVESDGGSPIVADGNVVVSGNGRKLILDMVAREGRLQSEYVEPVKAWATEHGIPAPPAGMAEPVLVRRITDIPTGTTLAQIAEFSNRSRILPRSEAELAEADARILTPQTWVQESAAGVRISESSAKSRGPRVQLTRDPGPRVSSMVEALVATRLMAGKALTAADVGTMLRNVGLSDDPAAMLAAAQKRAAGASATVVGAAKLSDRDVLERMANDIDRERYTSRISDTFAKGAQYAGAGTDAAAALEKARERAMRLDIESAEGYTAAEMQAELGVDLSAAVLATPDVQLTAEGMAQKERERAERLQEEREAGPAVEQEPIPPSPQMQTMLADLMARARARADADRLEAERKAAAKKKEEVEAGGGGEQKTPSLEPVYQLMVPAITNPEEFAAFIYEWATVKIRQARPDIVPSMLYKNPAALRDLQRTAQHILGRLATDLLGTGFPRLQATRDIMALTDNKTAKATVKDVAYIYSRIHAAALRETRQNMVDRLEREIRRLAVEPGRFRPQREDIKRRVTGAVERWSRTVISYLRLNADQMQQETERLKGILAEANKEDAATGYGKTEDKKFKEAFDAYAVLVRYGGMIGWMPGQIAEARDEIMEQLNGKRAEHEAKVVAREEKAKDLAGKLTAAVAREESDLQPEPNAISRFFDSSIGILRYRFNHVIRFAKGQVRADALAAIEEIGVIIGEGAVAWRLYEMDGRAAMDKALSDAYGSVGAGLKRQEEYIPDEARQALSRQGVRMTYGHALQLYGEILQRNYAGNVVKHNRAADLPVLRSILDSRDLRLHQAAVKYYIDSRPVLSAANHAVTGMDIMSEDQFYIPAQMKVDSHGLPMRYAGWSPIPPGLTPRIKNNRDFDEHATILDMFNDRLRQNALFIAYGERGLFLRDVLGSVGFQSALERFHGTKARVELIDHVASVLRGGKSLVKPDSYLAPLNVGRRWIARVFLSGNVSSALKQVVGIPVFANVVGCRDLGKYLTHIDWSAVADLRTSPGFRARYSGGWSEETTNILSDHRRSVIAKAYDMGMLVNSGMDAVGACWFGQGYYRDLKARFLDEGRSPEESKQRALTITWNMIEETQQSGRTENLLKFAREYGALARFFLQFKNSPLQQLVPEIEAVREVYAGTEGAKKRLLRALIINRVLVPAGLWAMTAGFNALMGKEPEDNDERQKWAEILTAVLLGQFGAMFTAGNMGEAMIMTILGAKRQWQRDGLLPVESATGIIVQAGKVGIDMGALLIDMFVPGDLYEVTTEDLLDDMNKFARRVVAPYRHVSEAIKNRE